MNENTVFEALASGYWSSSRGLGAAMGLCAQKPQPFAIQLRWGQAGEPAWSQVKPLARLLGTAEDSGKPGYVGSFACQRTYSASPCAEVHRGACVYTHTPPPCMLMHTAADTPTRANTHMHTYTHMHTPGILQTVGPWESGLQAAEC